MIGLDKPPIPPNERSTFELEHSRNWTLITQQPGSAGVVVKEGTTTTHDEESKAKLLQPSTSDTRDDEIRTTICNANGTRPALFVPEISFDILVRRQIARLEQPGIQCVDLVYEELQRIASQSEPTELTRFPFLRERMVEVVSLLLKRCMGPTQMMVSNLVKVELAVSSLGFRASFLYPINTDSPLFPLHFTVYQHEPP